MTLRLQLPFDSDESTVLAALRSGSAERRKKAKAEKVKPSDLFAEHCELYGLPKPVREAQFAIRIGRKWAFDFCWHAQMIAVEIEGLVVRRVKGQLQVLGRHASITGFREDCEKYATAALFGWTVVRFEQSQVTSRYAIGMVERILKARGAVVAQPEKPF